MERVDVMAQLLVRALRHTMNRLQSLITPASPASPAPLTSRASQLITNLPFVRNLRGHRRPRLRMTMEEHRLQRMEEEIPLMMMGMVTTIPVDTIETIRDMNRRNMTTAGE
jgi:hypothetical protein